MTLWSLDFTYVVGVGESRIIQWTASGLGEKYLPIRSGWWQKGDRRNATECRQVFQELQRRGNLGQAWFLQSAGRCGPTWGYTSLGVALEPVVSKNTRNPLGYELCKSSPSLLHFWIKLFYRFFTLLCSSSIWRCGKLGRGSHYCCPQSCTYSPVLENLHFDSDERINWILCSILLEQEESYILAEAFLCEFWLYLAVLVWF